MLESEDYKWKRFWCPRGGTINLDDRGFLYDPDSIYGRALHPDVLPYSEISGFPCLVLLGEPGLGKTTTLKVERRRLEAEAAGRGDSLLPIDLRSVSSDGRLIEKVFGDRRFKEWVDGGHWLHLYLDSLDECLLRIDNVAAVLADELDDYPVERLSVRIACRTAEWPELLETEFKRMWGEEAVGIFELVPLRRVDAVEAAQAKRLDPDAFLAKVSDMELAPLAIKPVTLEFLLNVYSRTENLPSNKKPFQNRHTWVSPKHG